LGSSSGPLRVEVQWPSGTRQTVDKVKANQVMDIKEPSR